MAFKEIFSFKVPYTVEVEKEEISKNKEGDEVVTKKKIKEKREREFIIRKPPASMRDDAELFYAARLSQLIKAGVMPYALLSKRYDDDGGIWSEEDKKRRNKAMTRLLELEQEYQRLNSNSKMTKKDKERSKELNEELVTVRSELQDYERSHLSIYQNTAESKARDRLMLWWIMKMSYERVDGNPVPLFGEGSFDDQMEKYDEYLESDDQCVKTAIEKLMYFIGYWFFGQSDKREDFEKEEKNFKGSLEEEVKEEVEVLNATKE